MRSVLGLAPAPESQTRLVPGPGTAYGGAAPVRRAPPPVRQKQETFLSAVLGSTKPLADNMPMTAYGFSRNGKFTGNDGRRPCLQQAESDIKIAKWDRPACHLQGGYHQRYFDRPLQYAGAGRAL
jgi:hypothetical protein